MHGVSPETRQNQHETAADYGCAVVSVSVTITRISSFYSLIQAFLDWALSAPKLLSWIRVAISRLALGKELR